MMVLAVCILTVVKTAEDVTLRVKRAMIHGNIKLNAAVLLLGWWDDDLTERGPHPANCRQFPSSFLMVYAAMFW